jgi:hypothetical protein
MYTLNKSAILAVLSPPLYLLKKRNVAASVLADACKPLQKSLLRISYKLPLKSLLHVPIVSVLIPEKKPNDKKEKKVIKNKNEKTRQNTDNISVPGSVPPGGEVGSVVGNGDGIRLWIDRMIYTTAVALIDR